MQWLCLSQFSFQSLVLKNCHLWRGLAGLLNFPLFCFGDVYSFRKRPHTTIHGSVPLWKLSDPSLVEGSFLQLKLLIVCVREFAMTSVKSRLVFELEAPKPHTKSSTLSNMWELEAPKPHTKSSTLSNMWHPRHWAGPSWASVSWAFLFSIFLWAWEKTINYLEKVLHLKREDKVCSALLFHHFFLNLALETRHEHETWEVTWASGRHLSCWSDEGSYCWESE